MSPEQRAIYRLYFQNRLSKINGMAFQNFFTEVMQHANANFSPIKPQGAQGDWKNDGHDPVAGRYYQVYAPEELSESQAVSKINEDFSGLLEKWGDGKVYPNGVKEFFFVINDYYRITQGGYPTTTAALQQLKKDHTLEKCELFRSKDLEEVFFELSDDIIISILGFPPDPSKVSTLNLEAVNEVINHIIETITIRSLAQTLANPDFDEKLEFNDLRATAPWLKDASYRSGTLEDYFNANSKYARQEIRDKLRKAYEESATITHSDESGSVTLSDKRLHFILEKITPQKDQNNARLGLELQNAALVIMAYFFECCDIFEEPVNANAG